MKRKLKIVESKWLRAGRNGGLVSLSEIPKEGETLESCLLSADNGRMCCLGFAARSAGVKKEDLLGKPFPSSLSNENWQLFEAAFPRLDRGSCQSLVEANDDHNTTVAQKRAVIKKIFKKAGVEVEFVK